MHCVTCLGKNAYVRMPRGGEWLIAPIAMPIRCGQCLSTYFLPTIFVLPILVVAGLIKLLTWPFRR